MIAMTDSAQISGVNVTEALANIGTENRRKPYPPIFSSTPARMTDPAVGASTCASGSHVCTGHIGILTANEAKKASHSQNCIATGKCALERRVSMSVVPV